MADNTRNKGRAASLGAASSRATLPAPPPTPPGRPLPVQPSPVPRPADTDWNGTLTQILKRLDDLDDMKGALVRIDKRSEDHKRDFDVGMGRLSRELEENKTARQQLGRELLIVKHELATARECNRRMEAQLNTMVNQMRICNLRIDGRREEDGENIKHFVMDMAKDMRARGLVVGDIVAAYRVGKPPLPGARVRPRTIAVTFSNERTRNTFFYARSGLKGQDKYRGIFINDDVSTETRRQRDDYRAVAAVARSDGIDVRVHTDGILLDGQKYLLTEPHSLPERYTVSKAKTIELGGEIYFSSAASYLSNFYPTTIITDGVAFSSAEHCYQARKCLHAKADDKYKMVLAAPTALEAKRIADAIPATADWRNVRDQIMKEVVSAKFDQNPVIAAMLLATGDLPLNEATHNDHYGIGVTILAKEIKDKSYRGSNKLGHILVAKRSSLRAGVDGATVGAAGGPA